MTLVRYQPWNMFDQFRREMEGAFRHQDGENDSSMVTSDWAPAVDIKEDEKGFTLIADIPGVDPKNIDVHMENGILTIKGERESSNEEERQGYKRVERSYGSFYRRFNMPDTADADKIAANSKHGVLEITIPKLEKVQARKISVKH